MMIEPTLSNFRDTEANLDSAIFKYKDMMTFLSAL